MSEYLLFRPPRRQPRILAISSHANRLAIVVSDPWELRYIAERTIPMQGEKRLDACEVIVQESIVRERPQALAVLAARSTARVAAKRLAGHFGLPIVEISPFEWQRFRQGMKNESKPFTKTFFESLPERHVSKALFKNTLLLKTALLAHAALSYSLKQSYDAQPAIEFKK